MDYPVFGKSTFKSSLLALKYDEDAHVPHVNLVKESELTGTVIHNEKFLNSIVPSIGDEYIAKTVEVESERTIQMIT